MVLFWRRVSAGKKEQDMSRKRKHPGKNAPIEQQDWYSASKSESFQYIPNWRLPKSIHGEHFKPEEAAIYNPQCHQGIFYYPIVRENRGVDWYKEGDFETRIWHVPTQVRQWTIDDESGNLLVVPEPYPPRPDQLKYAPLPLLSVSEETARQVGMVPYSIQRLWCFKGRVLYVEDVQDLLAAMDLKTGHRQSILAQASVGCHSHLVHVRDGRWDNHEAKFQPGVFQATWQNPTTAFLLEFTTPPFLHQHMEDPLKMLDRVQVFVRKIDLVAGTVQTLVRFEGGWQDVGHEYFVHPVVDRNGILFFLGGWGIQNLHRIDTRTKEHVVLPLLKVPRWDSPDSPSYSLHLDPINQRLFVGEVHNLHRESSQAASFRMYQVYGRLFTSKTQIEDVVDAWQPSIRLDFPRSLLRLVALYALP